MGGQCGKYDYSCKGETPPHLEYEQNVGNMKQNGLINGSASIPITISGGWIITFIFIAILICIFIYFGIRYGKGWSSTERQYNALYKYRKNLIKQKAIENQLATRNIEDLP